ncbi:restriction endonuclease subunit S [Sphaerobacter thermophilus]|uniref:Restriction modification system DNA specificity domain protein n=1 Tax=Sphaerobacter thermophilus (strain ATCC 49802 / DSM 20745 / KCCM 41009 / NCIMB 13125 / S 6022) TaxID=479434 RepID=D1C5W4_SPHTD|nr:restriction endonuclease subunit S [Sphaerobacter thermophilus]ACZ39516.1 restriction modification system DNA specificity domain protein [Sphaerobacter thermophilus DSM 20745]
MREDNSPCLPPGWTWATIRDTGEYINGLAFRKSDWGDEGLPIIRIQNLTDPSKPFNRTSRQVDPVYIVHRGDILLSWSATLDAFTWRGETGVLNQHIFKVVPDNRLVHSPYLYHLLRHAIDLLKQSSHLHGSTMKHINRGPFLSFQVPLAPLAEQRRIVAEIEKHFTRLDAAVAALERARANLKRYRAAVLKAACEGRLVPTEAELARAEGRDYETGEQLLQRILQERRAKWEAEELAKLRAKGKEPKDDRWKARYKEPAAPDTSDLPELPEGWVWARLDQLLGSLRNGISKKPDSESGTPILRINAVRPLSVNMEEIRYLSGSVDQYADYVLCQGDLLFTRYNGSPELVGVCGAVRAVDRKVVYPDKLIRARLASHLCLSSFVQIVLNVGLSREFIARRIRTTAGQSGVSGSDIRSVPLPLPPLAEQRRIVAEVERRLSVVEELERQIEANLKRAERLRQAILKRAFAGKLVPQDPNDEPASVLLERIRAERAAAAAAEPKRRRTRRTGGNGKRTEPVAKTLPLFGAGGER